MLVRFANGDVHVVLRRRLRKFPLPCEDRWKP
jgi:hypothetical protein